jgi:hypothetical protein
LTKTPDLIERLAADLEPTPPHQVERRLALGIGSGLAGAFLALFVLLGVRPDIGSAALTAAFGIKFCYTLGLAICFAKAVERLSRPGAPAVTPMTGAFGVLALVLLLAVLQLAGTTRVDWPDLIMGSSSSKCPWLILVLALPPLAGALWAMKGLAPTSPTAGGATAGLLSGASAAWVYSFHCDEFAIPFLATWYTLGILLTGGLGAASGWALLRWR